MKGKESLLAHIKQYKSVLLLLVLAVIGLLLILLGGSGREDGEAGEAVSESEAYYSVRFYTEDLEKRIAALCEAIDGVGRAHVLLTLDGGTEYVYAENESGTARDYVIMDSGGGDTPILVQEIYPKIRGVAVVCTRGGDSEVQRMVTELLSAALDLPTSRIRVAGAK